MSDEKTLLPCPICGGQPDFQHFNITPKVKGRIICACGIELRQGENETEDDIRIIWNTRATLGRGTCRFEWSLARNGWADHTCSECGYRENTDIHVSLGWQYCPNCGRKVVDA